MSVKQTIDSFGKRRYPMFCGREDAGFIGSIAPMIASQSSIFPLPLSFAMPRVRFAADKRFDRSQIGLTP